MADCRRCTFFKKLDELGEQELERAMDTARLRGMDRPLGYCRLFKRGVTYYTGRCSGFREKPEPRARPLFEFFKKWGNGNEVHTGPG